MTDISDLTHTDQVALWAGRVVRKEAQIESMLRTLYCQLASNGGGGFSWAVVPDGFGVVHRDVKKMLKATGIDQDYLDDCIAALDRLWNAHVLRNRVVHDQWVEQDAGQFVSAAKGVGGPTNKPELIWDVDRFEACYRELEFCFAQVSGIYWSLLCFVGPQQDMWRDLLPMNREAIAGRIKLTSEFTWEATDTAFNAEERSRSEARAADFLKRHPLLPEVGLGG
ncbi:MAG: hypothetical protein JWQ39_2498 [Glaciihabitans sp.]|nr:hypothetical protein [Glaciihabitans sp.]